jgi:hypothetical protein
MPMGWNFKNLSPEQQQRMLRFSCPVPRTATGRCITAGPEAEFLTWVSLSQVSA